MPQEETGTRRRRHCRPEGRTFARKLPTLPCLGPPAKVRSHRHPKPTTHSPCAEASSPVDHQEEAPRSSTRSKSIRAVGLEGKRVIEKDGSPLPSLTYPTRPSCDDKVSTQENKSLDLSGLKPTRRPGAPTLRCHHHLRLGQGSRDIVALDC
uniref:Uncharacterized protein n=1 Tax=Leersia perrieri TaxID=77586 RepID=A0A0D9WEB8_9ORYZ